MLTIDSSKITFSGDSFLVLDISDQLPKHENWPYGSHVIDPSTSKPATQGHYYAIENRKIDRVVYHQTEGGYNAAWGQVQQTALFFVRDPEWKQVNGVWRWTGRGRGWPGFAYTFFVPFSPIVYEDKWVVFQCNGLDLVTWHTGDRCNVPGVGVAFQGYFPTFGNPLKGTDGHPSEAQMEISDSFWREYGRPVLGASIITGHFEHRKPECPGPDLKNKVLELQSEI
jgi:hypothetical protein